MSEDTKESIIVAFVIVILALILAVATLVGCHEVEETNRAAIKAGLSQGPVANGIGWVKKCEKPENP